MTSSSFRVPYRLAFTRACRVPRAWAAFVCGWGLVFGLATAPAVGAAPSEVRALWVDGFHPGFWDETQVRQLVADARRAGFNALFVEVRRRGDAFYQSRLEPRAEEVPAGFDPLGRLLALAHDPIDGPRLQVHAWMVAYNVWNNRTNLPPQANHPFRLHPDWLTRNPAGSAWDGANFAFDPGLPAVQEYLVEVALDLLRRYDVDGLHLDYIRYAGRDWGYHPVAVERFNRLHSRRGRPAASDPGWLQFRRDQVTALVRRLWLAAAVEKPGVALTAATIAFAPGPTTPEQWSVSGAYADVLQDWRGWLAEGILDYAVPMVYFRQGEHAESFRLWSAFAKEHAGRRGTVIGVGGYLNDPGVVLRQLRAALGPSSTGRTPFGIALYSYAQPTAGPRADFFRALAESSPLDPIAPPLFAEPAAVPAMPWKTTASSGHLLGRARHAGTQAGLDSAQVRLEGPTVRVLAADANGWFGAVDLPPGDYAAVALAGGFETVTADFTVRPREVARLEFDLVREVAGTPP